MVLKEDQERVQTLLKDTITLLCRNGLTFKSEFSVEALIGITLDREDVFLVNINEIIKSDSMDLTQVKQRSESIRDDREQLSPPPPSENRSSRNRHRRKRQFVSTTDTKSWSHSEISSLEDSNSQEPLEPVTKRSHGDVKTEPEDSWDEIEVGEVHKAVDDLSQDGYSDLTSLTKDEHLAQSGVLSEGGIWTPNISEHYMTKEPILASNNSLHQDSITLDGDSQPKLMANDLDLMSSLYQDANSLASSSSTTTFMLGKDTDRNLPYACRFCGKRYLKRDGLVRHLKTHDSSLFRCKRCTLFFNSEDQLKQHIEQRHGPNNMKHQCVICYKKFDRPFMLKKHMSAHEAQLEESYSFIPRKTEKM